MFSSTRFGALTALLVRTTSCVSSRSPSGPGVEFVSAPVSETVLEIEFSAAELPPEKRALAALCRCAELALSRGFRYLRIDDPEPLGSGKARWTLHLLYAPPPGTVILDVAAPTWEGDPPVDGVLDAVSFAATCDSGRIRP